MGRVKSLGVKRAGLQLFEKVPTFTEDFENNKKILRDTMPSKSVRNKVAGYLSRLARKQKEKQARQTAIQSVEAEQ